MSLRRVEWLQQVIPGLGRAGAYRIARENRTRFVVAIGRRLFIDEQRFNAFLAEGGRPLEPAEGSQRVPDLTPAA